MILKYLLQKEWIQMRRNPLIPRLILLFPVVIMLIMPRVMNMEVRNIRVDVVDNDHSSLSRRLTQRIAASEYFVFNAIKLSYREALTDVEQMDADLILEIPPHYERNLVAGEHPTVHLSANAVNGTKGSIGLRYLSQIVMQQLQDMASVSHLPASSSPMVKMSTINLYNRYLDYKVHMIPALMAILILLLCGILPALNIVNEKEHGTIVQMNVSPVGKLQFILAKLIPYWGIAILVMSECILLSWLVYDIVPKGNILWLYTLSLLFAFFFSGLGLVVSNYSDTLQQAIFVTWFFLMVQMIMSGLFTPVHSMPEWAQTLSSLNPARYFVDGMRTVFVRGGDCLSIRKELLALTLSASLMGIWAVSSYRKNS